MKRIRLGIVGCGAVTRIYHLPASKLVPSIEIAVLVDKNLELAKTLSKKYKIPYFQCDYHETFDLVDGIIVALPNSLHASVSDDFLKNKIPVLCEKPMATSSSEAKGMLVASRKYDTPLAVGFMRRFYRSSRRVKKIISSRILGELDHFDFEEGNIYQWNTTSGFSIRKDTAGGGVLIDTGSHTLDLLLWWLDGSVMNFDYKDDSYGGVEANCILELAMANEGKQISGRIELSRERKLRNSCKIFGSKGWLEFFPHDTENVQLHLIEGMKSNVMKTESLIQNANDLTYFGMQLLDFGCVCAGYKKPYVDGSLAYRGIKIIEDCYKNKKILEMPWITTGFDFSEKTMG
jgi:predicted dehydrogenase